MAVPSFLLGVMLRGLVDPEGCSASTHFHSPFDLPLGRVGMTEAQVRATGRKILVAKRPLSRVSLAVEKGETQGFMSSSEAMVGSLSAIAILGAILAYARGEDPTRQLFIHAGLRHGARARSWLIFRTEV